MIALVADMRNGNSTTFGPAYVQYDNCGAAAVWRALGRALHGWRCSSAPPRAAPACRPCSRTTTAPPSRRRWDGNPAIPYAGMGTLHNGGLGSPTQFMLDMEIRKAEWSYRSEIPVDAETLNWEEVLRVTEASGNFLESEHTLRHCRELWLSELFRSDSPFEGAWDGSEKAILDRCDELWRERLREYRPPAWPPEQVRALDQLLARARAEFGIR